MSQAIDIYSGKKCGGIYRYLDGTITSPGLPEDNYDNNLNCTYVIQAPWQTSITLIFTALHLQPRHPLLGCVNDSITVSRHKLTLFQTNVATLDHDSPISPWWPNQINDVT